MIAFVGIGIVLAAAWLALVVVTRVDELFVPGQGLPVGGLDILPGVQDEDDIPEGRINFLVLGLDKRARQGGVASRTDTMFIFTVDPQTKTAGVLGIPRDLWVEIPIGNGDGYYEARINTAYITGETNDDYSSGPDLAKEVIEHNLGIEIDHHVIIDFEGFVEVIDQLGGINVFVEEEIDDPLYSRTEELGDFYPLHYDVGLQHMDGQTALDYSRTRYGGSDLDRVQRQQQVIFAVIDTALEQRLVSVDGLLDMWSRYKDTIDTDVNDLRAPGFAALAAQIEPTEIRALSLGVATVPWVTPEGAQVLLLDDELMDDLVEALYTDQSLAQEAAFVEIQNGAGTDGLAGEVAAYLAEFGFEQDSLAAAEVADGLIRPTTEIVDFSGKTETVQRLASLLDVSSDQIRIAGADDAALLTNGDVDILVILGADAEARDFNRDEASGG